VATDTNGRAVRLPLVAEPFEAATGIRGIDTLMFGREKATSAYLVEATEPALVETGPTTSVPAVLDGLAALGVGAHDLAQIIVTHIHLDHAGGAGALAPHFPDATVWVHERGAPHLADPTKLVASAARIYGEDGLRDLFGPVEPITRDRLRSLTDGSVVSLGNRRIEAVYTPGHASHHVCLVDEQTQSIFVGDALGVFLPDVRVLRPATPPPEFDVELAVASVGLVAERRPSRLLFSHFGPADDVTELCRLATSRIEGWAAIVEQALTETDDVAEVVRILKERTAEEMRPASGQELGPIQDRYESLSSYEMNALGLMRYLKKRGEAAAQSES
jgi:glyoxylase-like metal-dependent hydrolase (beta-lactamase superfamily II)